MESSCRYQQKPDPNEKLREQLVALAHERPRFGYRRLGVLLARADKHVNRKRLFRVYRAAGLSVKRNRRKKLVRIGVSRPALSAPNEEWSLDFLYDALATGRTVRVLGIVDNFTRECLALEADTSFASQRVTRVLDDVIARRGHPKALRMDNGPNLPRDTSWPGAWNGRSQCITFSQESRCRTPTLHTAPLSNTPVRPTSLAAEVTASCPALSEALWHPAVHTDALVCRCKPGLLVIRVRSRS